MHTEPAENPGLISHDASATKFANRLNAQAMRAEFARVLLKHAQVPIERGIDGRCVQPELFTFVYDLIDQVVAIPKLIDTESKP